MADLQHELMAELNKHFSLAVVSFHMHNTALNLPQMIAGMLAAQHAYCNMQTLHLGGAPSLLPSDEKTPGLYAQVKSLLPQFRQLSNCRVRMRNHSAAKAFAHKQIVWSRSRFVNHIPLSPRSQEG